MPGLLPWVTGSNEAVRLQGFVQTFTLCPREALMKLERPRLDLNLHNNGLCGSIVLSAASQKLF